MNLLHWTLTHKRPHLYHQLPTLICSVSSVALAFSDDSSNFPHFFQYPLPNPNFALTTPLIKPPLYRTSERNCLDACSWVVNRNWIRDKIQECAKDGDLMKSFELLKMIETASILDYNAVLYYYLKSNSICINDLEKVFELMKRSGPSPNAWTFNILSNGLCRLGYLVEALDVLKQMCNHGFTPSFTSLKSLMNRSLSSGGTGVAAAVLEFMLKWMWKDAYNLLEQMRKDGCMPNVVTYSIFIGFLCNARKINEAFMIFETMDKEGCQPDLVTYNVLLHALCHHRTIEEVCNFIQVIEDKGCLLDKYSYCILADFMLKAGFVSESANILQKILSEGGDSVDAVALNIYLHGLCSGGYTKRLISLVGLMMEKGFVPTTSIYNLVLKGFCKEQCLDEALDFLDHLAWEGNGPDSISFNTIMSTACNHGESSMIRRILHRMDMEGMKLDVVGITCLMQYYSKLGKLTECFKLLKYMILVGYTPSTSTCNVLLDCVCKRGLLENAFRMFHEFEGVGRFPDTTSYNILIRASVMKSDYFLVEHLLMDMHCHGLMPDAVTYGSISHALCREGNLSAALNLEESMSKNKVRPGISYYNTMLGAAFRRYSLWDVLLILHKMEIEGVEPDAISLKFLYRTMERGGTRRFPNAMKTLETLLNKEEISLKLETQ